MTTDQPESEPQPPGDDQRHVILDATGDALEMRTGSGPMGPVPGQHAVFLDYTDGGEPVVVSTADGSADDFYRKRPAAASPFVRTVPTADQLLGSPLGFPTSSQAESPADQIMEEGFRREQQRRSRRQQEAEYGQLSARYDEMQRRMTTAPFPGAQPFDPQPQPQPQQPGPFSDENAQVLAELITRVRDPQLSRLLRALLPAGTRNDSDAWSDALRELGRYVDGNPEAMQELEQALGEDASQLMREVVLDEQRQQQPPFDLRVPDVVAGLLPLLDDPELIEMLVEIAQTAQADDVPRAGVALSNLGHYARKNPDARMALGRAMAEAGLTRANSPFAQLLLDVISRDSQLVPESREVALNLDHLGSLKPLLERVQDDGLRQLIANVAVARVMGDSGRTGSSLAEVDAYLWDGHADQVGKLERALAELGRPSRPDGSVRDTLLEYLDDLLSNDDPGQRVLSRAGRSASSAARRNALAAPASLDLDRLMTLVINGVHGRMVQLVTMARVASRMGDVDATRAALDQMAEHARSHPQDGAQLAAALHSACTDSELTYTAMSVYAYINDRMAPDSLHDPLPDDLDQGERQRISAVRERGRVLLSHLRDRELCTLVTLMNEAAELNNGLMIAQLGEDLFELGQLRPQTRTELADALHLTVRQLPQHREWALQLLTYLEQDPEPADDDERHGPVSDAVSRFLTGVGADERDPQFALALPELYERVLADTGLDALLARDGITVDAHNLAIYAQVAPDFPAERVEHRTNRIDVLANLLEAVSGQAERDNQYESMVRRWRNHLIPERMIPADAGAVRLGYMHTAAGHTAYPATQQYADHNARRFTDVLATTCMYLAVPHFLPPEYRQTLTGTAPPPSLWKDLRLPAPYVMVFHQPIRIDEMAESEQQAELMAGHFGPRASIFGGLLIADEAGLLDTRWGWLLAVRIAPDGSDVPPRAEFAPVTFRDGTHPAARYLLNAADLLAHLEVVEPPQLPARTGVPGSKRGEEKQIKSQEAKEGAWHGVHVIRYVPLPARRRARGDKPGQPTGPLHWSHWRKAHMKPTRIGIRNESGNLVGPVYGPDAQYGVTYTYREDHRPRKQVRADLSLRPDAEDPVYALPRQSGGKRGKKGKRR